MGTQRRGWQTNFLRNLTKRGVNKLCKKLRDTGTVSRRPGSGRPHSACTEENAKLLLQKFPQSAADFVLPIVRWSDQEHLFVRKENKSVAYCGNFWSRSLARFMRATQFASVSSCARRLFKYFRCKSLQIIWDTDDRWMSVSRDISRTVLWVCGLSSWLRTKSLTVSTFFQCGHKLMVKVNKQKDSDTENLICTQHGERLAILNTENIKKIVDE